MYFENISWKDGLILKIFFKKSYCKRISWTHQERLISGWRDLNLALVTFKCLSRSLSRLNYSKPWKKNRNIVPAIYLHHQSALDLWGKQLLRQKFSCRQTDKHAFFNIGCFFVHFPNSLSFACMRVEKITYCRENAAVSSLRRHRSAVFQMLIRFSYCRTRARASQCFPLLYSTHKLQMRVELIKWQLFPNQGWLWRKKNIHKNKMQ